MKEVEDFEGEDGEWLGQRGGEPFPPKQLPTAVIGIFWSTPAVSNGDLMDATEIEDGELITPGRVWARVASSVT